MGAARQTGIMGQHEPNADGVDAALSCSSGGGIGRRLRAFADEFDRWLCSYLAACNDVPAALQNAVRYSALSPGKRIRPFLLVECCRVVGGNVDDAWPVAASVECVHAFSLIHDDLPAMDDDDIRRGQPTCHKKFGEATAILAGDALIVLAFELLSQEITDPALAKHLVSELSLGAGWKGMIGGQADDILSQDRQPDLRLTQSIHERKTAKLFETACRLGAMVGGANPLPLASLGRYGQSLGFAFQIADDLLDAAADADGSGEKSAECGPSGNQTFPRCVGIPQSLLAARQASQAAIDSLKGFGPEANDLRALAGYVVDRDQ